MPDIRFFNVEAHYGDYFAKYDYMGVYPTLDACKGLLMFCESARKNGLKIPKRLLDSETRAYLTIKNGQYTNNKHSWER